MLYTSAPCEVHCTDLICNSVTSILLSCSPATAALCNTIQVVKTHSAQARSLSTARTHECAHDISALLHVRHFPAGCLCSMLAYIFGRARRNCTFRLFSNVSFIYIYPIRDHGKLAQCTRARDSDCQGCRIVSGKKFKTRKVGSTCILDAQVTRVQAWVHCGVQLSLSKAYNHNRKATPALGSGLEKLTKPGPRTPDRMTRIGTKC